MSGAGLSGKLGFAEVEALLSRADALASTPALDLSQVEQADSAGFALLLELTRKARAQGRSLTLTGASPRLRQLATFFGLDGILSFAA